MISPIIINITPTIAVPINTRRAKVRFQNTGISNLYLRKIPAAGAFTLPSIIDYDVLLAPAALLNEAGEAFNTNSIASFAVVSGIPGGILAIYETVKI